MAEFQASGVINDRLPPRVLLWVRSDKSTSGFDWVAARAGTFRRIRGLHEVDLSEWDVLVTDEPYAEIETDDYGRVYRSAWKRVPDSLYIFRVFQSNAGGSGRTFFEFNIDGEGDADTKSALKLGVQIPGHKMLRVAALPEPIQDLVKSNLLPAVEARNFQFGILKTNEELAPAVVDLRPFLFGPTGVIMAASYRRPAGGSVWLVPKDALDIPTWFDVAMTEWHNTDRRTFPNVSTWQTDEMWDTSEEKDAREVLRVLDYEFAQVAEQYESSRAEAERILADAAARAVTGPKSLLTSQDEPLQTAVYEALVHLGFEVEDMDQLWPERERREDFRITDPDSPDWLVLADATGVAKGAPGSKITTVAGYVTKYLLEEKLSKAPGIWVIVNHLFHRDPLTRGEVYRGDELLVLESLEGLAIDTAALFLLSQAITSGTERPGAARAWIRGRTGQVTVQNAIDWLAANS